MGLVDVLNQKRENTTEKQKGKRLSTKLFNYVVTFDLLNALAIYEKLLNKNLIYIMRRASKIPIH